MDKLTFTNARAWFQRSQKIRDEYLRSLLAHLATYCVDSRSNIKPRSTLTISILTSLLLFLMFEVSHVLSMHELGLAKGWILYRLQGSNLFVALVTYFLLLALIRIFFILLQFIPDSYRKMKEENERNRIEDEKD